MLMVLSAQVEPGGTRMLGRKSGTWAVAESVQNKAGPSRVAGIDWYDWT